MSKEDPATENQQPRFTNIEPIQKHPTRTLAAKRISEFNLRKLRQRREWEKKQVEAKGK